MLERFLGVSEKDAQRMVEAELGRKLPDDFESQVMRRRWNFTPAICSRSPMSREAIGAIGLPKCVASSGTPEKIKHGLPCAGLYDLLAPHIFSATQVARGKPAPDLFLFAAAQMRAAPERCLVIEDSVPGVTGAHAAGMTVLGFYGGSHCRPGHAEKLRAAGAGLTFDDMRQLPELIRRVACGRPRGLNPASIPLEFPAFADARVPGTTAHWPHSLDFRRSSLYLRAVLHLNPGFHDAAAQAAHQIIWLPDERLRCPAHGGHAGRGDLWRRPAPMMPTS